MAAALLVLIVLVAYRPSLRSEFVNLDDYQYVVDNEIVRQPSLAGVVRAFSEVMDPSTVEGYYQPLTMVSLMIDARLSGTTKQSVDPYLFHLTNVLLHAATTVLVFLWVRTFFGGLAIPFLVALFFALHPAQVESVSWISQRKTVLATFLAVASLIAYAESVRFGSRWWLVLSTAFYLLATLAKPTVLLLPLVLPLLDLWPLGRLPRSALWSKLPFLAIMLPMAYIAVSSQSGSEAGLGVPNFSAGVPVIRWVELLSYNTMLYVGNLLWPMNLSPYRAIPRDLSMSNPTIALSVAGTAALVAIWIVSWRKSKPLFVGLTAFGLTLAPALGAIRVMGACVADRFLYFPYFFLLLPLALLLHLFEDRFKTHRTLPLALFALFLVPMWILTRAQQNVWRDSKSLWTHVFAADPDREQAHSNLALIGLEEQDFDAAFEHAKRAHELDPGNAADLHLLGRAYVRRGLANKAIPLLMEAVNRGLGPNQPSGLVALAEARAAVGDESGASSAVKQAIALGYPAARAYSEIGEVVRRFAMKYAVAERWYRRAVNADPNESLYRRQLAGALEYLGRYKDALKEGEEALRLLSNDGQSIPESVQRAVDRIRKRAAQPSTRPAKDDASP